MIKAAYLLLKLFDWFAIAKETAFSPSQWTEFAEVNGANLPFNAVRVRAYRDLGMTV